MSYLIRYFMTDIHLHRINITLNKEVNTPEWLTLYSGIGKIVLLSKYLLTLNFIFVYAFITLSLHLSKRSIYG